MACAGTELELIVFRDTYEAAWDKGYRDLQPANQYNVDYSLAGTARVEHLLQHARNGMAGAGMFVESAKGECNLGQHEIAFRYGQALATCDDHSLYKTGAKEIASQEGMSLTFMAKVDEREGNSCHIHLSVRTPEGEAVMAGDGDHGFSPLMGHWVAGQLACLQADAVLRPQRQLLQALRRRRLRPDRGVGIRQPHLRPAPSATATRCGSRTGCRAATSTRTWPWRPPSPPGSTASTTSCRSSRRSSATPTAPTGPGAGPAERHGCGLRRVEDGAAR